MKVWPRIKWGIREHLIVTVFICAMAIVYVETMFNNKPWYDELYTYYYFISRGPVYAAIHWPVPNNHVGYSVLSAVLDLFGNSYIGLRGVSCIAATANLILLYNFACKFVNKYFATAITVLYAGVYLVHRLSVQGRGYTLATTCYLTALIMVANICFSDTKRRNYIIFAAAITMGLYIVPSSVYWVIPTCLTGGVFLLYKKQYKTLARLIEASLVAAVITLALYSLIWLAIGANLMSKDPGGSVYGVHQVTVVLKKPFEALKTGKDYMLATPYIQSMRRRECARTMPEYFKNLFDNYYSYSGITTFMVAVCVIICALVNAVKQLYYRRTRVLASMYILVTLVSVPVMLLIQSVQPYLRVLGFYSIPIIFGFIYIINVFCESFAGGKLARKITMITLGVAILLSVGSLMRPYYREPYAGRENDIQKLFVGVDTAAIDNVYYTDDFQKYVLKFYCDVTPNEVENIEDADYAILCPEMKDSKYMQSEWPVLYSYHVARLKYAEKNMRLLRDTNDGYEIYVANDIQ